MNIEAEINFLSSKFYPEIGLTKLFRNNNIYVKAGGGFGNYGKKSRIRNDKKDPSKPSDLYLPYNNLGSTVGTAYKINIFKTNNKGYNIFLKMGIRSMNINAKIGYRLELNASYYSVTDNFDATYVNVFDSSDNYILSRIRKHKNISIGLGGYLTYFHNKSMFFYSGLSLPFYFPIRKDSYDPEGSDVIMAGLEPSLSVGIGYKLK